MDERRELRKRGKRGGRDGWMIVPRRLATKDIHMNERTNKQMKK